MLPTMRHRLIRQLRVAAAGRHLDRDWWWEEVERKLKPYLEAPFVITRRKDEKFGEVVALLTEGDIDEAKEVCKRVLPKHWQPRYYRTVESVPLTETGKPARKEAERIAAI